MSKTFIGDWRPQENGFDAILIYSTIYLSNEIDLYSK
jgi:hypothetical protein